MSNLNVTGNASGTGTVTLTSPNTNSDYTVTLPGSASTIPIVSQALTFSGPTAARTVTLPDANFTAARTDAAQSFGGAQTFGSSISVGGATPSASGTGITFPATQSASTDANTLDDYEEGTWTPVVTSTGGTYANQAGRYTKVGRVVTCDFFLQNSSAFTYASSSAFFTITGLPFTPTSWSYSGVTGTVWTQGFNYNNDQSVTVKFVTPSATSSATILFKTSDSAATAGTIINSNNSGFIITGQVIFTV